MRDARAHVQREAVDTERLMPRALVLEQRCLVAGNVRQCYSLLSSDQALGDRKKTHGAGRGPAESERNCEHGRAFYNCWQ